MQRTSPDRVHQENTVPRFHHRPARNRVLWATGAAVVLIVAVAALWPTGEAPRFHPSEMPVETPSLDESFVDHIAGSRERIRSALRATRFRDSGSPFQGDYTADDVMEMRAPWQRLPPADCSADTTGFLFIHGISDSPYTLRPMAERLAERFPCAHLRGVLLPGHGTVPGDLLSVSRNAWRITVDRAVEDLLPDVDSLHLVGYSAGAALALEQAVARRGEPRLGSLVLLSPALGLDNPLAWLSPVLRYVQPWLDRAADRDAAKYESFPMNAAAQTWLLLRELDSENLPPLDTPVFLVATADDTTVDPHASWRFFCNSAPAGARHMIWYESRASTDGEAPCRGIRQHEAAAGAARVISLSHVGITIPPQDPHYGQDGAYRHCLRYRSTADPHQRCLTDDQDTVYGEPALLTDDHQGLYRNRPMRRTTFNPHHESMMEALECFLRTDCQP